MRPRLRADVRYVRSPDGVYVHGFAGACTLTGGASYEWLDRLAPFLTGEHVLSDLVAPLAPDQRAVVEQVINALFDQRLLVNALDDEPHSLSVEERRVYAPEIEFIRYAVDSAEHRFGRLRSARIVLLGAGPVLAALVAAGLHSGWRLVRVHAPADEVDELRIVARGAMRDDAQDVRVSAEPPTGAAADLVLCVSDQVGELVETARQGPAVGQVLVGGTEAWVTAVGPAERVAAESCWRRLGAWRGAEAVHGLLTGPVPGVVASHVALSCFSYLTGVADEVEEPLLTRIDLRDLTARTYRPRRWAVTARPEVRMQDVVADGLHERVRAFVDERVGVLGRWDEDDLPQVPLAVCRATVSDPGAVLPAWAPAPSVTGWGTDRDEARVRAALAGLATYASLIDPGGERADLLTGRACVVSGVDLRVPYRAPVGVAAGRSWGDAVTAGLRAHCEVLLAEHGDDVRRADLAAEVRDERAAGLLRLLLAADVDLMWADLGRVLGVPAFAFRAGGVSITTCASTAAEALRDGLERLLVHWQCGEPVDTVPTRWPVEIAAPRPGPPADDPRCQALAAALRRAGRTPVAIALPADDEVRALAPCLVRVVVDGD
jgi:hypothetical protein